MLMLAGACTATTCSLSRPNKAAFHRACKRVCCQSWRLLASRCCASPALQSPPPSASPLRGPLHGFPSRPHAPLLQLLCDRTRLHSPRLLQRLSRPPMHAPMLRGEQLRSECLGRCYRRLQCVLSSRSLFAPRHHLYYSSIAMLVMPVYFP